MKKVLFILSILFVLTGCKKEKEEEKENQTLKITQSEIFYITTDDWTCNLNWGYCSSFYFTELITNEVFEKGMVALYIKEDNEYIAMPFTSDNWDFIYTIEPNFVNIEFQGESGSFSNPGFVEFRLVVIPPELTIEAKKIDMKDFKAVSKTFDL